MIEKIILANLIDNDMFMRKVIPYIKKEYFEERIHQVTFNMISEYVQKYNDMPSKQALEISLIEQDVNDEDKEKIEHLIRSLQVDPKTKLDWIENETEKWCQKRAVYLALTKSLEIYQGRSENESLGAIPKILQTALAVSFDTKLGHDFFGDAHSRYDYYHLVEHKIPFDLNWFNEVTKGGASKKSLTILMAGVNVGKSAMMCHMAAANIRDGKKVLYITLEMSEEMISQRIDANLMDLTIDQVTDLPEAQYKQRIKTLRSQYGGDLKVKEYPTKQGGSANFRFLLNELKLKHNYIPDIIYVDYMNICLASTIKMGRVGMFEYVKAVSEELRGLAVEFEVPIITATQFNREGFKSSDPGLDNASESFGTTWTGDLIVAMVRDEELENELVFILLKTRYGNKNHNKRISIGVNIEKMQFFDIENNKPSDLPYDPETGEIFSSGRVDNLEDIWKK